MGGGPDTWRGSGEVPRPRKVSLDAGSLIFIVIFVLEPRARPWCVRQHAAAMSLRGRAVCVLASVRGPLDAAVSSGCGLRMRSLFLPDQCAAGEPARRRLAKSLDPTARLDARAGGLSRVRSRLAGCAIREPLTREWTRSNAYLPEQARRGESLMGLELAHAEVNCAEASGYCDCPCHGRHNAGSVHVRLDRNFIPGPVAIQHFRRRNFHAAGSADSQPRTTSGGFGSRQCTGSRIRSDQSA